MIDLEIIKRCAEKMGYITAPDRGGNFVLVNSLGYDPLHDDAQAMALVKKFRLGIYFSADDDEWGCYKFHEYGNDPDVSSKDLNRAICECVTKLPD